MKRTIALAAAALAVFAGMGASCESTAALAVDNFRGNLTGAQAVPATSTGSAGTASAVLVPTLSELAVTISHAIDPADVTKVTVNSGAPGQTGGALFDVTPPLERNEWSITLQADDMTPQGSVDSFFKFTNALQAGNVYVNVETRQHSTGEIRAQLIKL